MIKTATDSKMSVLLEFVKRLNAWNRFKFVQGICTDITSQEVRKRFHSAACHLSLKVYSWLIFIFLTFLLKNTQQIKPISEKTDHVWSATEPYDSKAKDDNIDKESVHVMLDLSFKNSTPFETCQEPYDSKMSDDKNSHRPKDVRPFRVCQTVQR